jgi:hypothetical protein
MELQALNVNVRVRVAPRSPHPGTTFARGDVVELMLRHERDLMSKDLYMGGPGPHDRRRPGSGGARGIGARRQGLF